LIKITEQLNRNFTPVMGGSFYFPSGLLEESSLKAITYKRKVLIYLQTYFTRGKRCGKCEISDIKNAITLK